MSFRWPWRRREDTTGEALACFEHLEQRDPEVLRLAKQLRAAQRRNHFSLAVADAIARTRES